MPWQGKHAYQGNTVQSLYNYIVTTIFNLYANFKNPMVTCYFREAKVMGPNRSPHRRVHYDFFSSQHARILKQIDGSKPCESHIINYMRVTI